MKKLILIGLIALLSLSACAKQKSKAAQANDKVEQAEQAAAQPAQTVLTDEMAIDVLFRSHRNAKKICYDTSYNGSFFLYYAETEEEGAMSGWYFLTGVSFFYIEQNKTYYVQEIPDNKYAKVFPDTSGLTCKDK